MLRSPGAATRRNIVPFDYWHEKVALTHFANELLNDGWTEVGL